MGGEFVTTGRVALVVALAIVCMLLLRVAPQQQSLSHVPEAVGGAPVLPPGAVVPLPSPIRAGPPTPETGTKRARNNATSCPRYAAWLEAAVTHKLRFAPVVSEVAATASSICLLDPVDFAVAALAVAAAPMTSAIYVATPTAPEGALLNMLLRRNKCAGAVRAKHVANPAVAAQLACDVSIIGSATRWTRSMAGTGYGNSSRRHVVFASSDGRQAADFERLARSIGGDLLVRRPWAAPPSGASWATWPPFLAPASDGVVVISRAGSWTREDEQLNHPEGDPTAPSPAPRVRSPPPTAFDPEDARNVGEFLRADPALRFANITTTEVLVAEFRAEGEMVRLMRAVAHRGSRTSSVARSIDAAFDQAWAARSIAFRRRLSDLQHLRTGSGEHNDEDGIVQKRAANKGTGVSAVLAGLRESAETVPESVGSDALRTCPNSAFAVDTGCQRPLTQFAEKIASMPPRSLTAFSDLLAKEGGRDRDTAPCLDLCTAGFASASLGQAAATAAGPRSRHEAMQKLAAVVTTALPADAVTLSALQRFRAVAVVGCDPWWLTLGALAASLSEERYHEHEIPPSRAFYVLAGDDEQAETCDMSAFSAHFPHLTIPTARADLPPTCEAAIIPANTFKHTRPEALPPTLQLLVTTGKGASCAMPAPAKRVLERRGFFCTVPANGFTRWARAGDTTGKP